VDKGANKFASAPSLPDSPPVRFDKRPMPVDVPTGLVDMRHSVDIVRNAYVFFAPSP